MPCYDGGPQYETSQQNDQIARLEAMLCEAVALLTEYDPEWRDIFDYEKSGIEKSYLDAWIKEHEKKDKERREQLLKETLASLSREQLDLMQVPDEVILLKNSLQKKRRK